MSDQQIGRNLARARGATSQKDIADAMRGRGWRWNQGTVSQVESGERPLRLAEAEDLARILRLSTGSVLARGEWEGRFADAWLAMNEYSNVLSIAVEQYLDAQIELAQAADRVEIDQTQHDDVVELLRATPESVVRDRREHHGFEVDEDGPLLQLLLELYRSERG